MAYTAISGRVASRPEPESLAVSSARPRGISDPSCDLSMIVMKILLCYSCTPRARLHVGSTSGEMIARDTCVAALTKRSKDITRWIFNRGEHPESYARRAHHITHLGSQERGMYWHLLRSTYWHLRRSTVYLDGRCRRWRSCCYSRTPRVARLQPEDGRWQRDRGMIDTRTAE